MKKMKTARGLARAQRRSQGGGDRMLAPSAAAQAAQLADRKRAARKIAVKLYHKAGAGIGDCNPRRAEQSQNDRAARLAA